MDNNSTSSRIRSALSFLMFGAMFVGFAYLLDTGCEMQSAVKDVGDAYLLALREDRIDDAYGMLAADLRAKVPRNQFERQLSTPLLRRSTDTWWNSVSASSAGKGCLEGGVTVDDDGESLTFYMWREGNDWRVYAIYYDEWDYSDQPWTC